MEAALQLILALLLVSFSMVVIMFACDAFEPAADYLGTTVYKMGPGIRGASIEAIASSLPELFTTMFLLFVFHDEDGFAAGVATCAGSAIFNGAVIPALCILAVTTKGVKREGETEREVVEEIRLQRKTLVRDSGFFLLAEILLIAFLNGTKLTWWMGLILMLTYVVYVIVLLTSAGAEEEDEEESDGSHSFANNPMDDQPEDGTDGKGDEKTEGDDDDEPSSALVSCVTFDFNALIYAGKDYESAGQAWTVLLLATATIALACYALAEAVMLSAQALDVPPYFTAVILGAAASSVPDTFLSYKDALKGDYDDAVANAIGSNIFDICFALGFPLFLYGLIYGDVVMNALDTGTGGGTEGAMTGGQDVSEIQSLRVLLIIAIGCMLAIFFITGTTKDKYGNTLHVLTQWRALALIALYLAWTVIIVIHAMNGFLHDVSASLLGDGNAGSA